MSASNRLNVLIVVMVTGILALVALILAMRADLVGVASFVRSAERLQNDASAVSANLWEAQSGERAFELTGRQTEIAPYDMATRRLVAALARMDADVSASPSLQTRARQLRALTVKTVSDWDSLIADRRAGAARDSHAGVEQADLTSAQQAAQSLQSDAAAALDQAQMRAADNAQMIALMGIAGGAAFAFFVIIGNGRLRRLAALQVDALADALSALPEGQARPLLLHAGGREVERLKAALESVKARLAEQDERDQRVSAEAAASSARREAEIEGLRARIEVSSVLAELATRLTACASAREVVETTQRLAPALAPGCRGALFVREGERRHMMRAAEWNDPAGAGEDLIDSSVCWGLRLGRVHLYDAGEAASVCPHVAAHPISSAWCAPLIASGEAVGMLYLEAGEAPFDLTLADLEMAAEAIAAALANVHLHSRLGAESIRDPLTGLFNRRHLEATLEVEIARARRSGAPLSVVMLDLDRFKSLNDSHGHELGDLVLMALAETLQNSIRKHDLACRYGGEEFMLLLPDTTEARAVELAERIRKAVRSMNLSHIEPTLTQITASFGVASLAVGSDSFATLLRAADRALYAAKGAGRDQVVSAGPDPAAIALADQVLVEGRARPAAT